MLEARSIAEARVYVDHEPCPACGGTGIREPLSIVERGERLAAAVRGTCASCGADRPFELLLGEDRVPPGSFGNAAPSTLIDAGGWFAIANAHAEQVPASAAGLDDTARRTARTELGVALAALREVLKFAGPDEEAVPRDAFFTAAGKRALLADPRQFTRLRLGAIAGAWDALMLEFAS